MGFCPIGQGGAHVASGATSFGGAQPINLSGGLVSKGHPVGATGLSMIHELALQLRGEAGERQHPGAHIGLELVDADPRGAFADHVDLLRRRLDQRLSGLAWSLRHHRHSKSSLTIM